MKYTMRSASVERIFFVLGKRPRRPKKTEGRCYQPCPLPLTKKSLPLNSNLDILA